MESISRCGPMAFPGFLTSVLQLPLFSEMVMVLSVWVYGEMWSFLEVLAAVYPAVWKESLGFAFNGRIMENAVFPFKVSGK